jgi:hypothetical protein
VVDGAERLPVSRLVSSPEPPPQAATTSIISAEQQAPARRARCITRARPDSLASEHGGSSRDYCDGSIASGEVAEPMGPPVKQLVHVALAAILTPTLSSLAEPDPALADWTVGSGLEVRPELLNRLTGSTAS